MRESWIELEREGEGENERESSKSGRANKMVFFKLLYKKLLN